MRSIPTSPPFYCQFATDLLTINDILNKDYWV